MNKKFAYALGAAAAIALVACSADSISNADVENWPSDFNVAEYSAANPDLATYQALTAVAEKNDAAREVILENLINAYVAADSSDKTPDEKRTSAQNKAEKELKNKYVSGNILDDDAEWTVFFDDSNAVKSIFTDFAGLPESFWPGAVAFLNGMYNPDSTINIFGQTAMQYRLAFKPYHQYGFTASQDLAFLKSVVIDENLIKYQYNLAGRYEGRPYRFCRVEDNATLKQMTVTYTYDTIPNGNTEIIMKDTVVLDTDRTSSSFVTNTGDTLTKTAFVDHQQYILESGDTLSATDFNDKLKEDPTLVKVDSVLSVTDTVFAIKENTQSIPTDTLYSDKIVRTTVKAANSPNAIPVGKTNEVWDFSADMYCRSKDDNEVYLIPGSNL